ncbi:hypothetical protein AAZX31_15G146200 [Glycine max]
MCYEDTEFRTKWEAVRFFSIGRNQKPEPLNNMQDLSLSRFFVRLCLARTTTTLPHRSPAPFQGFFLFHFNVDDCVFNTQNPCWRCYYLGVGDFLSC